METGDVMYILPHFRFTSYAIGIFTGIVLRKIRDIKVSSTQLYSLWTLSFSILIISLRLAAELTSKDYDYNPVHAAFMTLLPIPFCSFFALVIFSAEKKISSK